MQHVFNFLLLTGSLHFVVGAVEQQQVKYAGPVVYSGLPPPVVYFPTVPKYPDPASFQNHVQLGPKRPVEYIPLPYQDLPVLVYQSKEHPPIHVVDNPDAGKLTTSYLASGNGRGLKGAGGGGGSGDSTRGSQSSLNEGQVQSTSSIIGMPSREVGGTAQASSVSESHYGQKVPQLSTSESFIHYQAVLPGRGTNLQQAATTFSHMGRIPLQTSSAHESYEPGISLQHETNTHFVPGGTAYIQPADLAALASGQGALVAALDQAALNSDAFHKAKLPMSGAGINLISSGFTRGRRYRHFLNTIFRPYSYRQQSKLYGTLSMAFPYLFHQNRLNHQPSLLYASPSVHVQPIYIRTPNSIYSSSPFQAVKGTNAIVEEMSNTHNNHYKETENLNVQSLSASSSSDSIPAPHVIYTGHPPIHVYQHPIIVKESTIQEDSSPDIGAQEEVQYLDSHQMNTQVPYEGGHGESYAVVPAAFAEGQQATFDDESFSDTDGGRFQTDASNNDNRQILYTEAGDARGAQDSNSGNGYGQQQIIFTHHSNQGEREFSGVNGGGGTDQPIFTKNVYLEESQGPHIEAVVAYTPVALASGAGQSGEASSGEQNNQLGHRGLRALIHNLATLGHAMLIRKPVNYGRGQYPDHQQNHHQQEYAYNGEDNDGAYYDHVTSDSVRDYAYDKSKQPPENTEKPNYPKVNYKIPPTTATAAPEHHRPPIIIYKGLNPPVHVYQQIRGGADASKSSSSSSSSQQQIINERTPTYRHAPYRQETQYHPPVPNQNSYPRGEKQENYGHAPSSTYSPASNDQRVYGAATDYHPVYDHNVQGDSGGAYHTASWIPINIQQYLEAQAIGDHQGSPDNKQHRSDTSPIERISHEEESALEPPAGAAAEQSDDKSILSRSDTDANVEDEDKKEE